MYRLFKLYVLSFILLWPNKIRARNGISVVIFIAYYDALEHFSYVFLISDDARRMYKLNKQKRGKNNYCIRSLTFTV
jgi:hypothetical protein